MKPGLLPILLLALLTSCKKEECTGDCVEVVFTGKVIDLSNKQGVERVPIQVFWQSNPFGFFSNTSEVADSRTDKQGQFTISKSIDKSKFEFNSLHVEARVPNGYISRHGPYEKEIQLIHQYAQRYEARFEMHQEANLDIKLVKNQSDSFNLFALAYSYDHPYSVGVISGAKAVRDTTIRVKTAAGVYTKVRWEKTLGIRQSKTFVDSILCDAAKNNTLIVAY